jgi:hypothetical protein
MGTAMRRRLRRSVWNATFPWCMLMPVARGWGEGSIPVGRGCLGHS